MMIKRIGLAVAGLALTLVGATAVPAQAATTITASSTVAPGVATETAAAVLTPPRITKAGTPMKAFPSSKHGVPTQAGQTRSLTACPTLPAQDCYFYNAGIQNATMTGADVNTRIENPTLRANGDHSLGEVTVIDNSAGLTVRNIVEAGWVKGAGECNSPTVKLCFFVAEWKAGVFGGYNGGFVDYAANTDLNAGDVLTGGKAAKLRIQYDPSSPAGGAWWVYADKDTGTAPAANWIGYFPSSIWTAAPSVTFTSGNQGQAFGEIADQKTQTCSQMGNGIKGDATQTAPYDGNDPSNFGSWAMIGSASANSLTGTISPASFGTGTPAPSAILFPSGSVRTFYYGSNGWPSPTC
jgi:hypothetical protein